MFSSRYQLRFSSKTENSTSLVSSDIIWEAEREGQVAGLARAAPGVQGGCQPLAWVHGEQFAALHIRWSAVLEGREHARGEWGRQGGWD